MIGARTISKAVRHALVSTAVVPFLASMALAQAYPVRLTRPWKPGDRYRISATGWLAQESSSIINNGASPHTLEKAVTFVAEATVLEIRRDGRIARESFTIDECLVSADGRAKQLVPRGTVIVASADRGNQVFRMNGKAVTSEIDDALSLIVSLESGETSNDDVFGTARPRRVGESWGVNPQFAVKWLHDARLAVNEKDIRGFASAPKKVIAQNQNCLVINSSLAADKLAGDVDGLKLEDGHVQINVTGVFPINIHRHCVEQSQHITIHILARGEPAPGSRETRIDFTTEFRMTARYAFL